MSSPSLIVAGSFNYPKGSAPSNRIHLYCKAFKEAKGLPVVINLDAPFNSQQSFRFIGRYEGIPFCFSRRTYIRKRNFFIRNIERVKGLLIAIAIINKHKKRNTNIIVLFFSTLTFDEIILSTVLMLLRIKIIRECNEAPAFIIKEERNIKLQSFFLKNFKLKSYDGIIVISDFLKNYYSKIYSDRKIFQIPILVDLNRFEGVFKRIPSDKKIITYVGYLGGNKDGLGNLLKSVSIAKRSVNNLQLNLVGTASKNILTRLEEEIYQLSLKETVCLLGSKDSDEIPIILANSDLLVLARPDNNQAKAGFPTKLGEYLASTRPVIITKTGEIPKYLEDNKSAYLAEPDDIEGLAQKLLFAINDPKACEIGLEGFHVAEKYFDYRLYGEQLLEIFNRVIKLSDSLIKRESII